MANYKNVSETQSESYETDDTQSQTSSTESMEKPKRVRNPNPVKRVPKITEDEVDGVAEFCKACKNFRSELDFYSKRKFASCCSCRGKTQTRKNKRKGGAGGEYDGDARENQRKQNAEVALLERMFAYLQSKYNIAETLPQVLSAATGRNLDADGESVASDYDTDEE